MTIPITEYKQYKEFKEFKEFMEFKEFKTNVYNPPKSQIYGKVKGLRYCPKLLELLELLVYKEQAELAKVK